MGRHLEIERKFLVKRLPAGWKRRPCSQIVQGYFPVARKDLEIRLRHKDSEHFITLKGGRGRRRLEEEIQISKPKFRALWPFTGMAHVSKRRYEIPCGSKTIEVDVYGGPHRGLITADVEFGSTRESSQFQPPDWLGREITGKRKYANEQLARRGGLHRIRR
ncbi:MAG: adenylate cyclase [Verrucomicrobia bacterium]|nr:MAG: adenylate cyclase [Verrucomicrobiota bacterium]